jgi:hypothetical protein
MRNALLPSGAIIAGLATLAGCRDLTPPQVSRPLAGPSFAVSGLSPDSVGICLPAGTPDGSYTFSWTIQHGQPGDIHDVSSPATITIGGITSSGCLIPWRREAPLAEAVAVDVIVTETATPAGVALDSVDVVDRLGDHVYLSATDTASTDATAGGTLVYYHQPIGPLVHVPLPVSLLPLPGPNPSMASGDLRLTLDPTTPPNPCGPVRVSGSGVAICGIIRNPGGETFTGGVLGFGDLAFPFATDAVPPSPCRQYVIQGAVAAPVGLVTQAASDPGRLTLRFDSKEHPDGAIGGSPAGSVSGGQTAGRGAAASVSANAQGACVIRFGF